MQRLTNKSTFLYVGGGHFCPTKAYKNVDLYFNRCVNVSHKTDIPVKILQDKKYASSINIFSQVLPCPYTTRNTFHAVQEAARAFLSL